jgi:hypothetical protein
VYLRVTGGFKKSHILHQGTEICSVFVFYVFRILDCTASVQPVVHLLLSVLLMLDNLTKTVFANLLIIIFIQI